MRRACIGVICDSYVLFRDCKSNQLRVVDRLQSIQFDQFEILCRCHRHCFFLFFFV